MATQRPRLYLYHATCRSYFNTMRLLDIGSCGVCLCCHVLRMVSPFVAFTWPLLYAPYPRSSSARYNTGVTSCMARGFAQQAPRFHARVPSTWRARCPSVPPFPRHSATRYGARTPPGLYLPVPSRPRYLYRYNAAKIILPTNILPIYFMDPRDYHTRLTLCRKPYLLYLCALLRPHYTW